MKEKSNKYVEMALWILIGVSVLVMYRTHREVPFMMDDLWYSTMLSEDTPISSFADIVKSQIWHYHNWGGRSMTHGILQLTLLAGEQAADLLNVGVTLLLAWALCISAGSRSLSAFFAGMAMVLGLNANWKMSMFWQSGAANYLYITVFILFYAYCFLRELPDEKPVPYADNNGRKKESCVKELPGIVLWIIPLGILAGWSNENMGPAVWVLSLIVIGHTIAEKRKVRLWMILGNLSCLFGSIMVIIAPGNFVRAEQAVTGNYGVLWRCFLQGYAESKAALEYLFPTLLVLGILLFAGKCVLKIKVGRRNSILLLCALLSWGAMALSPHYPDRAAFGTMALFVCVILSMAEKIVSERNDLRLPILGVFAFIWLKGMYFCGEYLSICWGWIR